MNTLQQIADLKNQLELVCSEMPQTFYEQKMRNKVAFEISKQIEQLENPTLYAENANHWEAHELRF